MTAKVFVDTSAFYALASETDAAHRTAQGIHESLKREAAVLTTTSYILLESISLLQRRHGVAAAERFGEWVSPHVDIVWVTQQDHQASWEYWKRYRSRGLSFVDCSSFVVMESLGVRRAFAFDRQFTSAGFALVEPPPEELVAEPAGSSRGVRRAVTKRRGSPQS